VASLYILFSSDLNKYYVGITKEFVDARVNKHNTSFYGKHFTSAANDWQTVFEIECESFSEARQMELYIKKMKSRKFIEKLIADEKEIEKLKVIVKSI